MTFIHTEKFEMDGALTQVIVEDGRYIPLRLHFERSNLSRRFSVHAVSHQALKAR